VNHTKKNNDAIGLFQEPGPRIVHLKTAFILVDDNPPFSLRWYAKLCFYPTSSSVERPIGMRRSARRSGQQTGGQKRKSREKMGKAGKSML
jgi:hypothetical protein